MDSRFYHVEVYALRFKRLLASRTCKDSYQDAGKAMATYIQMDDRLIGRTLFFGEAILTETIANFGSSAVF